jgi:LysM domain-containing protein
LKFLRWFLGFILLVLTLLAWQEGRSVHLKQVIEPKLERSTLEGRDFVYYTVQAGDTLDSLARKFRIPTADAIQAQNPGLNPAKLPVSKQIKIPLR